MSSEAASPIVERLKQLAVDLDNLMTPIKPLKAKEYAELLNRLLADAAVVDAINACTAKPSLNDTKIRERTIALHFRLVSGLIGNRAGKFVAKAWGNISRDSLYTYNNRHRHYVDAWIERMTRDIGYEGLSQKETFKRELEASGLSIPSDKRLLDKKLKKLSNK